MKITHGRRVGGKSKRSYVLFLLCLTGGFNFADRQVLSVLVEPIKRSLHVNDAQIGVLTGASFAIIYLTFGLPLALWADRGVRRSLLAGCLAVWSLMTVLCGFAQNYSQILVARMGLAVGESGGLPTTNSLLADLFPRSQRGLAIGTLYASSAVGTGLGLAAGGFLEHLYGWRAALVIIGVPGLLLALVLRLTVKEPERGGLDGHDEQTAPVPLRRVAGTLWRIPSLRYALGISAIASITDYGSLMWFPAFFQRVHGFSESQVGLWFGTMTILGFGAGYLIGGWLSDFLQRRDLRWNGWLGGIMLVAAVPFGALAIYWPSGEGALIWCAAMLAVMAMWSPAVFSATLTLAPTNLRSITMATISAGSTFVGMGVGPLLVGALNDALTTRFGVLAIRHSLLLSLAGYLLAAPLCFFLARRLPIDILIDGAAVGMNLSKQSDLQPIGQL